MPCLLCPSLLCCLLLLLPFPLASGYASKEDTVVITSSGPIRGKQVWSSHGAVTCYLGIPYAEPPLGNLRFKKPVPRKPWSETLEATSFGNSCPQFISLDSPDADTWVPKTPLSEDCLSLNIWVPPQRSSSPVSVLVWVHGGGFFTGSSSVDVFNGGPLAATENVIVVTMNYRLGCFGFLFLPPAAPGNLGLWDQRLAMDWVKKNAAAFGGDPSRVTLFGQSAGSACVNFHLLSSQSQDLFAHAVMQSGTANAFWAWRSSEGAKQKSLELVQMLGCSKDNNTSIVQCLQTKNVSELIQNERAIYSKSGFGIFFPFIPTTDGEFLLGNPAKLMAEGKTQVKPVLMGETSDEAGSFTSIIFSAIGDLFNLEHLVNAVKLLMPNAAVGVTQAIASKYSEGHQGPAKYRSALSHFLTDILFACPIRAAARNIRKTGSPVYAYVYAHRPTWSPWPKWVGAAHADEVPFVFGTLDSMTRANQTYTEAEARLSQRMMHYWGEFARNGEVRR